MGGSSGQVTGYRYYANFLLFIGNPIEKVLGINFDKRGWLTPLIDEMKNPLSVGVVVKANLYGENEGGVAGQIHAKYGTNNQEVVPFYKDYMDSNELPASAFPYQSYLAFTGLGEFDTDGSYAGVDNAIMPFYVGNSGYMKEMLLWPKRTRIRNDGRRQWYEMRGDGAVVCEIGAFEVIQTVGEKAANIPAFNYTFANISGEGTYTESLGIYSNIGSDAYGGAENQSILETLYAIPTAQELSLFDLVEITATITGSVRKIEHTLHNVSEVYKYSVNTTGGEDEEKHIVISVVCKKGGGFPYLKVIGTGTIPQGNGGSNLFFWTLSSQAKPLDIYNYENKENGVDINPIHKIREILTDDTAMNKPESSVNDENFTKAADWIWNEGLGISWSITEKSCIDAINELCYHIEAGIRVNRQTGLYEMVLFRDNWFEESEIHTISESKIKSMQYEITNADEVINQVNVNYYDRSNIKNSSFSISESGLIQTLGRVNAETLDFPYFMNMRNAEIVANWKLKQLSTGAFKGSFTTGWREARKWNRYDLIRLPWSKRWTGTILVRIISINLGGPTNNEVSIEFIEVIPATGMLNTTIVIDDPIDTKPQAPQQCNAKVFELPYFEAVQAFGEREVNTELADNPEAGYLCAIAEKPQNNSLNANLQVDSGNGFERVATINYCETAYLDQAIDRMSSTFTVKNVGNIASVRAGSQILINDEIMVYQSYDAETKVLTVKRGAFGIPQDHAENSILYFADDFVAVDQTLYVDGEFVDAKVLTTTPSGVLSLDDAITHKVEFNARAIRPYPPANVKINGKYWNMEYENSIDIAWVHRNRLQQTGGEILGFYEAGVAAEAGVTYVLKVFEIDDLNNEVEFFNQNIGFVDHYTIDLSGLLNTTKSIRIELSSDRDGFSSYQPYKHTMFASFNAPSNLTASYAGGEINLNWEFSA